jgi:HSP20 family protein
MRGEPIMANIITTPQKDRAEPATPETTRGGAHFTPRVDIFESDQELLLFADMPGVRPEDIELHYENGELIVHGKVCPRQQNVQLLLEENDTGDFYRVFTVHESIDSTRIEAQCKNGVLTVHLPKTEAVKPRKIAVKSN